MMVDALCDLLDAKVLCGETDKPFLGVYTGDLLSRAMSRVETDCIWVTIMSNVNVVAVATLTEPAAITVDVEKAQTWIKNGAQPTDTVRGLLKKAGVL